jgi:hypothetical protein
MNNNETQKNFVVGAILTRISFSKDGGLNLGFATNEITSQDKVDISALHGGFGWLAFKENAINLDDLPSEDAEDKTKTPSKRLRSALFVLYKQKGIKQDFETWYRESMEKIIEQVKGRLD